MSVDVGASDRAALISRSEDDRSGGSVQTKSSFVEATDKKDALVDMAAGAVPFGSMEEYEEANERLGAMAAAYYDSDEVLADDATYDEMLRRLAATEQVHPEWASASPVHAVAAGAAADGEVVHHTPMLSLDNVFSTDELRGWAERLEKLLGRPVSDYVVEPKLDGLAVAARYEEGKLVLLATRGTGRAGEDVTHNARLISGLPPRLAEPATIEVRGECFMSDADFEAANAARLAAGERPFVNPRNAAAGALRADKRSYDLPLSFLAYGSVGLEHLGHASAMARLAVLGVSTTAGSSAGMTRCRGVAEVVEAIERLGELRGKLGFAVDGAVVKADRAGDQDDAGCTSRAPRWAIAYKFAAEARLTRLVDITVETGRTGRMTPVAVLEPVFVGGTTITSATLNNVGHIAALDVRIGDMVWVRRAGEVIPEVTAVQLSERPEHALPWVPPATCPSCGSAWDMRQKVWYCSKGRSCQAGPSIRYAVSRPCLDIEGLGDKLVDALVERGLVADVGDIFRLDISTLSGLERMGETSAAKVIAEIERSRSLPLSRVFAALGVRLTGVRMSRRIARHFRTMAAICAASVDDLAEVEGVGPIRAASIVAELAELAPVIEKLAAAGVNMVEPEDAAGRSSSPAGATPAGMPPLAGRKVVVTGTVPGLTRKQAQEAVERLGGKATGSVSKLTDLVVVGEGAGSKEQKARELGIEIMAAEDFAAMVAASMASDTTGRMS